MTDGPAARGWRKKPREEGEPLRIAARWDAGSDSGRAGWLTAQSDVVELLEETTQEASEIPWNEIDLVGARSDETEFVFSADNSGYFVVVETATMDERRRWLKEFDSHGVEIRMRFTDRDDAEGPS